MRGRLRGALIGLAIGDALGAAVEFKPPGTFKPVDGNRTGGPHGLATRYEEKSTFYGEIGMPISQPESSVPVPDVVNADEAPMKKNTCPDQV